MSVEIMIQTIISVVSLESLLFAEKVILKIYNEIIVNITKNLSEEIPVQLKSMDTPKA